MTTLLLVIGCLGLVLVVAALLDERAARHRHVADVVVTDLERWVRRR